MKECVTSRYPAWLPALRNELFLYRAHSLQAPCLATCYRVFAAQVKGEKENVSYVLATGTGTRPGLAWPGMALGSGLRQLLPCSSPGSRTSVIYRAAATAAATAGRYLCETCQTV